MTVQEAKGVFTPCMISNDALLMRGVHGIGKTEIVKEWAKENDIHLEVLYLSTQDVGDLTGIPNLVDGLTEWSEPVWLTRMHEAAFPSEVEFSELKFNDKKFEKFLKEALLPFEDDNIQKSFIEKEYKKFYGIKSHRRNVLTTGQTNVLYKDRKKCALFLDEISRASLDCRQAALQLVLEREIHQHKLPVYDNIETLVIAADNPDNGDYAVEALDPALNDRFLILDLESNVESWVKYARSKKLNEAIIKFILENNEYLHFMPDLSTGEDIGATPRSWEKVSKYLDIVDTSSPIFPSILKGKIGGVLGLRFLKFLENYEDNISLDTVIETANKAYEETNNIEEVGEKLKELLKDVDVSVKNDFAKNLIQKANKSKFKDEELVIPTMGVLYSLELEMFAGVLKPIKESDTELYKKIVKIDKEMNDAKLFYRFAKNLKY